MYEALGPRKATTSSFLASMVAQQVLQCSFPLSFNALILNKVCKKYTITGPTMLLSRNCSMNYMYIGANILSQNQSSNVATKTFQVERYAAIVYTFVPTHRASTKRSAMTMEKKVWTFMKPGTNLEQRIETSQHGITSWRIRVQAAGASQRV